MTTYTPQHPDREDTPLSPPRFSRKMFLYGTLGAGSVAALSAAGGSMAHAATPADQISVDLSQSQGWPSYVATGFLHGLSQDGQRPPAALLNPLKPRLFRGSGSALPGGGWALGGEAGYRPRWQNAVDRYRRIAALPKPADYAIVMSDLWGAEGVTLKPTDPYPGDNGDWTYYEQFVRQVMADAKKAGMRPEIVQYEIWNEPDYTTRYFPRTWDQYQQMWQRGYRIIKELEPDARIEGPTYTGIRTSGTAWHMDDFLDMAVASRTVPDILSWHSLGRASLPVGECDLARSLLDARSLGHIKLEINEYGPNDGLVPGYDAWYITNIERSGMDYAARAIYGPCCMFPYLDGLVTYFGDQPYTTSEWWVYQKYGSLTGDLVTMNAGKLVDGLASADENLQRVRVLLGNSQARVGKDSTLGTVRVHIDNIDEKHQYLIENGRIRMRVERIADQPISNHTDILYERWVKNDANGVTVDLDWSSANAAYVITLGSQESKLPDYILVSETPGSMALPQGWQETATLTLRNYTDAAITLPVHTTVPSGYDVSGPSSATLTANTDTTVSFTVQRTSQPASAGSVKIDVGNQSTTINVSPTSDWCRVATMTASSTHAPSSPDNLNDGNTDSNIWGGGGAGGWNDDTPNVFPDWVAATWDQPVTLSRVVVYTLDSTSYPASAYGIRSWHVQVADGQGGWSTVGTVTGNVVGSVTTQFAPVTTKAIRILITDSNDHTYSRLIAVQGYSS